MLDDWSLSCADYTFPALRHHDALALIAALEFEAVDIGLFAGRSHVRPSDVFDDPLGEADRLADRLEIVGLGCADVFLIPGTDFDGCDPFHRDPEVRAGLIAGVAATARFCAAMGVGGLTVLPGVPDQGGDRRATIERVAPGLSAWVEVAAAHGVQLTVEPHAGSCVDRPDLVVELLERVPGLGVTLDPAHFVFDDVALDEVMRLLPWTCHVQLRGARPGTMQARMIENEIGIDALLGGFAAGHYRGHLATEYVWSDGWDCTRVDNISETAILRDQIRAARREHLGR